MLNALDLTGSILSDEGLAYIAARVPCITQAKLSCIGGSVAGSDTGHLTDAIGPMLVRAWPHLKEIDLSGCVHIGDQVVLEIVQSGALTKCSLGGCNVSEKGTNAIANRCDALLDLDLTGCVVKESALNNLLRGNPELSNLRLDFVDVEEDFLHVLRRKYPKVTLFSRRQKHYEKPAARVWNVEVDEKGGKKKKKKGGKKKKKKKK